MDGSPCRRPPWCASPCRQNPRPPLPGDTENARYDDSPKPGGQIDNRLLQAGIRSIHFANQFGVVKTIPGYASSIAIFIDNAGRYEIIATIAGDDSILLIPNQNIKHEQIKKALQIIFPDLEEQIFKL